MATAFTTSPAIRPQDIAPLPFLSRIALRVALAVVAWEGRVRTRTSLRNLSAHQLADIGLDAQDATVEAEKPFWRA